MRTFIILLLISFNSYAQKILPDGVECDFSRMKGDIVMSNHIFSLSKTKTSHAEKMRGYSFAIQVEQNHVKIEVIEEKSKIEKKIDIKDMWSLKRDPKILSAEIQTKAGTSKLTCH
jgi:hypothetical protein